MFSSRNLTAPFAPPRLAVLVAGLIFSSTYRSALPSLFPAGSRPQRCQSRFQQGAATPCEREPNPDAIDALPSEEWHVCSLARSGLLLAGPRWQQEACSAPSWAASSTERWEKPLAVERFQVATRSEKPSEKWDLGSFGEDGKFQNMPLIDES